MALKTRPISFIIIVPTITGIKPWYKTELRLSGDPADG
jgi:hypothetical protein